MAFRPRVSAVSARIPVQSTWYLLHVSCKKRSETELDLYSTYVGLTKAFDTVSRVGLWRIMAKYGCPTKFITIVRQLHYGMQARVQDGSESSEPFSVSNGVKQGCVSPRRSSAWCSLPSWLMPSMARTPESASNGALMVQSSISDGRKRRPRFNRTPSTTSWCWWFCPRHICSFNKFSDACDNFGLTISTKKTEVLHQPAPGKPYVEPNIIINNQRLNVVYKFTYLGSTLSRNVMIDDEVNARLAKASVALGRRYKNVLDRRGIKIETEIKIYRAVVLITLLYGREAWTVYQKHARELPLPQDQPPKASQYQVARKDTRHRSPHPSWHAKHLQHAHTVTAPLGGTRSPYARPSTPQKLLSCELQEGKCSRCAPKKP